MELIEYLKQKSKEEIESLHEEGGEDDEDDLNEDADARGDEDGEGSGAEVLDVTEAKNDCSDDKKTGDSTEELMDKVPKRGRPASDDSPPPQKRVMAADEETIDAVSVGGAESPSSPLAVVSPKDDALE